MAAKPGLTVTALDKRLREIEERMAGGDLPASDQFLSDDEERAFFACALSVFQGVLQGDPAGSYLEPNRAPQQKVINAWVAAVEALRLKRSGAVDAEIERRRTVAKQLEVERMAPAAGYD